MRVALALLLVAALALAVQYAYFYPYKKLYVILDYRESTYIHYVEVFKDETFAYYCKPAYHGCVEPQLRSTPGVVASAWRPDGTPVEYVYKKAVGLFEIPANVSTDWFRWNEWIFWGRSLTEWGRALKDDIYGGYLNKTKVVYGLQVAVKLGEGPVLACLKRLERRITDWLEERRPPKEAYYVACPGDNASKVIIASVTWEVLRNGTRRICMNWWVFWQRWWHDWGSYAFTWKIPTEYSACTRRDAPPKNITAAAGKNAVYFHVDGELFYTLNTTRFSNEEPWLYTGPYELLDNPTTAVAAVDVDRLPGRPMRYLGTFRLLIGNDTLAVPRYVTNMLWGSGLLMGFASRTTGIEAGVSFDGFSASVGPGATSSTVVLDMGFVNATMHGEVKTVQRGLYFTCEVGEAVARGEVERVGRGYLVKGPAELYCTKYAVLVREFNKTAELVGDRGSRLVYRPDDVLLGNGTLLRGVPLEVAFDRPGRVYAANYSVYYRVVVETPLGASEAWAERGSLYRYPGADADLGNGTRVVVYPAEVAVERPAVLRPGYAVYYLASLHYPWGSNHTWVQKGAVFKPAAPDPWLPGNGTKFAGLLVNGTPPRGYYVDRPTALYFTYREKYYWASVATPFNKTEGWYAPGSVIRLPDAVDFGNGTRLVDPQPATVVVDKPVNVVVSYRRQYWVEVRGVEEWRGWAYEGSKIWLNETAVGGVAYKPLLPYVEADRPKAVTVGYLAAYAGEFRDFLGLPNPTATVELCGKAFPADPAGRVYAAAETDKTCQLNATAWPVSPYTLALVAVAAAAAALLLKRRKK
ncbi:hypothetical protein Pogu_2147 [Pyrobaculum oguniense TE7]|uniref:Thermopsin n=1 Tax=Pyrobaculum oguniense (strain DSM 13380 / JCM 10595 / TE7) TaxID=698757 RepID=H6QCX5_PYROT|nr:hypothetical protein Pogu_2147 [Pyrobaculum oguniense TE7]